VHWHRIYLLAPVLLGAALGMGNAAGAALETPPDISSLPSAAAFDTLFRRLELGDLGELDPARQSPFLAQLKQLLPPGDAHRQRLFDSERCWLDFINANKDGFAFADSHLVEALQAQDNPAAVRFYYCRGNYQANLTTTRDGLTDFDHGIDLARGCDDEPMLASGLLLRGGSYSVLGVHGKALADLLEAQRLFQKNELEEAANQTLQNIGVAYRRLGYPDKAREYLAQSIEHEERVGDHSGLFASILQLGYADQEAGHDDKALASQQRGLQIATALGDRFSVGSANLAIASVQNDLHHNEDALIALQKAEADFSAIADAGDEGMVQFERARALAGLGQQQKALDDYNHAEAAFDASGNPRYQEMLHEAKAQTLEAGGQSAAALAEFKRYIKAHDEVQHQRADQQAQMLREQFDSDRSRLENARLRAEQALKERQLEALQGVRAWQQTAMGLLAVLLGLLALQVIRQLRKLRSWKRMASIDPLTGVANRRGVEHFTRAAMRQARAQREPLAVLALDIDRFKSINDRFGHSVGDRVLQHIAQACNEALRDRDLLGRIGGEEFLAVLPQSTLAQAADIAERLRCLVEALAAEDLPAGLRITISVGFAEMTPQDAGFADLERRADDALYRAKAEGRNRIVGASGTSAHQDGCDPSGKAPATGGR
jgi:diguanylate cyclase (GGDEF)-like protein